MKHRVLRPGAAVVSHRRAMKQMKGAPNERNSVMLTSEMNSARYLNSSKSIDDNMETVFALCDQDGDGQISR